MISSYKSLKGRLFRVQIGFREPIAKPLRLPFQLSDGVYCFRVAIFSLLRFRALTPGQQLTGDSECKLGSQVKRYLNPE